MEIKRTSAIAMQSVSLLSYGHSGAGKTSLIKTLPRPITLSAEGGLLSLADADLPYIEISKLEDVKEVFHWLEDSDEAKDFDSVALDSISEISEVVLTEEKGKTKDGRQAYGQTNEIMSVIIRSFRDLNKHVYFTAKCEKMQDDAGRIFYGPSMTGNKLGQSLPYYFDEVLALRVEKDDEGKNQRALLCDNDGMWSAKDRSGKLDLWELPDLGEIIKKIQG